MRQTGQASESGFFKTEKVRYVSLVRRRERNGKKMKKMKYGETGELSTS
jgi:hypothetical protein